MDGDLPDKEHPGGSRGPRHTGERDVVSRRPIRVVGLLLILQVAGLAGFGAYEAAQVNWRQVDPAAPTPEAMEAATFVVLYAPPAVLALIAAAGFLFMTRRGWLLAAIAQGLSLGASLWLYSERQPYFVYPIMVYCILMILYLNSHDVRVVFHSALHQGRRGTVEVRRGSR